MATVPFRTGLGRRRPGIRLGIVWTGAMMAPWLWAAPARAQINPFQNYNGPTLRKADLDLGMQAAQRLLNADGGRVGASEAWTGGASGNSGTMTVQRAFERDGNPCRSLLAVVNHTGGTKRSWQLNVCRLPSGEWKIV
jgi:surface antigen